MSAFVFASSCSIYGVGDREPRTEESPVNPLTAYAISKVRAERDLAQLAASDFRVTCLRFATACGMSPRLRLDLVLNDFVASAVAVKRIDILSDGSPWRPLIHVRDMARAIDWAIGRAAAHDPFVCLNAGSDAWNYQVRELGEAVAAIVGGVETHINQAAPPDKRSYRVSFKRFASMAPEHQPRFDLTRTIADLAEGLEAMGFCDPNFRESRLMRLNMLSELRRTGYLDGRLCWTPSRRLPVTA